MVVVVIVIKNPLVPEENQVSGTVISTGNFRKQIAQLGKD